MLKRLIVLLVLLLTFPQFALALGRVDTEGATVDNKFTEGNQALAEPATVLGAAWLNDIQEELVGIVEASGQTPAKGSQGQLKKALVLKVDTIASLRGVIGTETGQAVQVMEDGRGGLFKWEASDHSADVAADLLGGIYVPPDSVPTGVSGAWVRKWNGPADFRWYGAKGDGVTDDTAAIRSALDNHTVLTGAGVFLLVPTVPANFILPLTHSVQILGHKALTFKIASGSGSFKAIIGNTSSVDLSGLLIDGVIFDNNAALNAPPNLTDLQTYPRISVYAQTGSNMVVKNCLFKNDISINTVSLNGAAVSNCRITDNDFVNICVGSETLLNDHSTIYTNGHNMVIAGNTFEGASWSAVTAIETHGGLSVVTGNTIVRYQAGMNLTGITHLATELTVIADNVMDICIAGIKIWSYKYAAHTTGYGIENMLVTNNTIRVLQVTSGTTTVGAMIGIVVEGNSDMPIKGLRIIDNSVEFEREDTVPAYTGNNYSMGIGAYTGVAGFALVDCEIIGNTVKNAPVAGIRFSGCPVTNLTIKENRIHNAGQGMAVVTAAFKLPIFLTPTDITGFILIERNHIIDDFAVTRAAAAMYLSCSAAGKNIEVRENRITVTGDKVAFVRPYLAPSSPATYPVIQGDIVDKFLAPLYTFRAGSYVKDLTTQKTWNLHADGTTWLPSWVSSTIPTSAYGIIGSYARNPAPVVGSPKGWYLTTSAAVDVWTSEGNL
ncbi:pectate lyase superfamily protein [Desulfuromonas soudanensis]|uniref:Pectate lyase superfamily protein n=1 Tax=Desulfuromonas soudanensis TaxID=1603606 RepID=A0A0M4CVE4_9BACT|nr:hypothetical protein [Desulfuromonas soudanensis]ALC15666.1 pectate lyase superfamily protein [Desulfuromonas soudanensis]